MAKGKKTKRLEDWRQILRDAQLRATPARIELLELLETAAQPLTHLEVVDGLAHTDFDRSTLFRALQDLTEAGLARRLELGDRVWRFERVRPALNSEHDASAHPHLLCVDCGSITCLTEGQVELTLPKGFGTIEDVLLKGHCPECSDESD